MKQRLRETAGHTLVYGVGGAARQAIGFLLVPLYMYYLDPESFGAFAIFLLVINLVAIIPTAVTPALFRSYYDCEDDDQRRIVFTTAFAFVATVTGGCCVLGYANVRLLAFFLFRAEGFEEFLGTVILTSFFNSLALLGMAILRARRASKHFVIVSLLAFVTQLGSIIYLVAVTHAGLQGVLTGYLWGAVANCVLLMPLFLQNLRLEVNRSELAKQCSFGWPYLPTQIIGFISQSIDRILLERLASLAVVGLYAIGQKLASSVSVLFVQPFSLIAIPSILSAEKDSNAEQFYARLLTYYLGIALGIVLVVTILANSLLQIFARSEYICVAEIVPILGLSMIFYDARTLLGVGLVLKRKTHYFPIAVGIGAMVNIVCLSLLIPFFAEWGAASASLVSSVAVCFVYYRLNMAVYPIDYEWLRMGKLFGAWTVVYVISRLVTLNNPICDLLLHCIFLSFYPMLLVLLGFFDVMELREIKYIVSALTRRFFMEKNEEKMGSLE